MAKWQTNYLKVAMLGCRVHNVPLAAYNLSGYNR